MFPVQTVMMRNVMAPMMPEAGRGLDLVGRPVEEVRKNP